LDIIVFATGFDAMTGPLFNLNIAGRDGLSLRDVWREGPRSYLGLQVVGFPNLFTVTGPGSPSVLTNMPVAIEQHVEWISRCIADMRAAGQTRIEAKPDAVDDWMVQVQEVADRTLFTKTLHSWYLGANVPGKPRVFMPYIGGMAKYRRICDEVAEKGYEGFALGA
jgi:cation diffusion facilitator CzcD-associated flavoprotein CzcO